MQFRKVDGLGVDDFGEKTFVVMIRGTGKSSNNKFGGKFKKCDGYTSHPVSLEDSNFHGMVLVWLKKSLNSFDHNPRFSIAKGMKP